MVLRKILHMTEHRRKSVIRGLITALIDHEAVTTTSMRARVLKQHADKLITHAKKAALQNMRYPRDAILPKRQHGATVDPQTGEFLYKLEAKRRKEQLKVNREFTPKLDLVKKEISHAKYLKDSKLKSLSLLFSKYKSIGNILNYELSQRKEPTLSIIDSKFINTKFISSKPPITDKRLNDSQLSSLKEKFNSLDLFIKNRENKLINVQTMINNLKGKLEKIKDQRRRALPSKRNEYPWISPRQQKYPKALNIIVRKVYTPHRIVPKILDVIAPRYRDRKGGYTRVVKLENRLKDNAQMCRVELVEGTREIKFYLDAMGVARAEALGVLPEKLSPKLGRDIIKYQKNAKEQTRFRNAVKEMHRAFFSNGVPDPHDPSEDFPPPY